MKINVLGAEYSVTVSNETKEPRRQIAMEADLLGRIRNAHVSYFGQMFAKEKIKEENTMKVSYKGVTGELARLEHVEIKQANTLSGIFADHTGTVSYKYAPTLRWELEIWDNEKGCKISFKDVSMEDVKFLGGEVTYGG